MTQRIELTDPKLAEREQRGIDDLSEAYPDKVIVGLDARHKQLGKRLGKLYTAIGYGSRREMIEAWGFTFGESSKGGRPTTLDPEAVMSEIAALYQDKEKPASLKDITESHPELKGKIKTLSNKARELFDHTLAVELQTRGLLKTSEEKAEEKAAAMAEKPAKEGRKRRSALTDEDIAFARAILREVSKDIPNDEKPRGIKGLRAMHPTYSREIDEGVKRGLFTAEDLAADGILRPTKAMSDEQLAMQYERSVRAADASVLSRAWLGSGLPAVIPPGDQSVKQREGVVAVDVSAFRELREAFLVLECSRDVSVGDGLASRWQGLDVYFSLGGEVVAVSHRTDVETFLIEDVDGSGCDLAEHAKSIVIDVGRFRGHPIALVRHRFLAPLSAETLLYALRGEGLVIDSDLAGGDEWIARLEVGASKQDFQTDLDPEIVEAVKAYREHLATDAEQDPEAEIEALIKPIRDFYQGKVRPKSPAQLEEECDAFKEAKKELAARARKQGSTVTDILKREELVSRLAGPRSVPRASEGRVQSWNEEYGPGTAESLEEAFPEAAILVFSACIDGHDMTYSDFDKLEALRRGDCLKCATAESWGQDAIGFSFVKAKNILAARESLWSLSEARRAAASDFSSRDLMKFVKDPSAHGAVDGLVHARIVDISGGRSNCTVQIECFVGFDKDAYLNSRER